VAANVPKFHVGQVVRLVSNPAITGAVVQVDGTGEEPCYEVFIDGAVRRYYESQLELVAPPDRKYVAVAELAAVLSALQVRHPSTSRVYSLNAARIDCVPYQFRPVLKFIRADRPRLLIADGVGVGKTIEAGLILKELQARAEVRRVMIICPKPLITERKWETEMRRFDERFVPLDGDQLRHCIWETEAEGQWPDIYSRCIVPYSLLDEALLTGAKRNGRVVQKGLVDLQPPPRFDLIIVDEAAHIRNRPTYAHRCVRFLAERAEALLLLTATPLEMSSRDLFVLLNVLRPDVVRDERTFQAMTAPNPMVNAAAASARGGREEWQQEAVALLRQAAETPWAAMTFGVDPDFRALLGELEGSVLDRPARVACLERIEGFHTLAGLINRTRRRDVGEFTVRRAETIRVEFTPAQREVHDEILRIQAFIMSTLKPSVPVKFLMTMIRRQAASCLYGLAPFLEDILSRRLSELALLEAGGEADGGEAVEALAPVLEARIKALAQKVRDLDRHDPKLDELSRVVREKVTLPNRRLMVFSTFRHTLAYLMSALTAQGIRVGLVHGDVPDEERRETRRRFEAAADSADALDLLLFSEVGSEGLDYQFCDAMVNYDLPWNPMRIEQRIGRIDRRGQTAEAVRIINMVTPGTVDAEIYERCLLRIGIFERELGASDEILGSLATELRSIAEDLTLTVEERQLKLEQLADNQVRAMRQQQKLEDEQAEFFALQVPRTQAADALASASSPWLSPRLLEGLVRLYLRERTGSTEALLGDRALKTIRLSGEARTLLLQDFERLPINSAPTHREWRAWLRGAQPLLKVTFEQAAASQTEGVTLLSPMHPLLRQASEHVRTDGRLVSSGIVADPDLPTGDVAFAIYQWRFLGLQEDVQFRAFSTNEALEGSLERLLVEALPREESDRSDPASEDVQELERRQFAAWSTSRQGHREATSRRADFRRASLRASHGARRAQLDDLLRGASDERIQRLHRAEIANLDAEFERRTAEIDSAIARADLQSDLVAVGVLRIIGERKTGGA